MITLDGVRRFGTLACAGTTTAEGAFRAAALWGRGPGIGADADDGDFLDAVLALGDLVRDASEGALDARLVQKLAPLDEVLLARGLGRHHGP